MHKVNIALIQPSGYTHSSAFQELSEFIASKLSSTNYQISFSKNSFSKDAINIVLGAHLLEKKISDSFKVIIVNTEQLGSINNWTLSPLYREIIHENYIWDYSFENIKHLKHKNYSVFNLTYETRLDRLRKDLTKDIDILFYGCINKRRASILDALINQGLNVKVLFDVYSDDRDKFIERSKFILNLHYYDTQILQQIRVFYPLINSVPVLSEDYPQNSAPSFYQEVLLTPNNQNFIKFASKQVLDYHKNKRSICLMLDNFKSTASKSNLENGIREARDFFNINSSFLSYNSNSYQVEIEEEIKKLIDNKNYTAALPLIKTLLKLDTSNSKAYANLSIIQFNENHYDEAATSLKKAISIEPGYAPYYVNLSQTLLRLGDIKSSLRILETGLKQCSDKKALYLLKGNLCREQEVYSEAFSSYSRALDIEPNYKEALWNRALLHEEICDFSSAILDLNHIRLSHPRDHCVFYKLLLLYIKMCQRVEVENLVNSYLETHDFSIADYHAFTDILIWGEFFVEANKVCLKLITLDKGFYSYYLTAQSYSGLKLLDRAIIYYELSVSLEDTFVPALVNCGNLYLDNKEFDKSKDLLEKAYKLQSDNSRVNFSLGNYYYETKEYVNSIQFYQFCVADEEFAKISFLRLGNVQQKLGDYLGSLQYYASAIGICSVYQEAWFNLAIAHHHLGNFELSACAFENLLNINPQALEVNLQLGHQYYLQNRFLEAITCYQKELELNPHNTQAKLHLIFCEHSLCFWDNYEENIAWVSSLSWKKYGSIPPWQALSLTSDPNIELEIACLYSNSQNYIMNSNRVSSTFKVTSGSRIKIGFISSDFYNHATMYLIEDFLLNLDSTRFEIYLYDYSMTRDCLNDAIATSFANYFCVNELDDLSLVALIKSHQLDFIVDLKGYTYGSRINPFTERIATHHISFLGYPGTSGSNIYDFIIADEIVAPSSHQPFYSEKILHLSHCYQPNKPFRSISQIASSRCDHGIPENAFVYACFNANYKISPREFDVWMDILMATDSVLWLLRSSPFVEENLRKEAIMRKVDPNRLIFSDKCEISAHLERHRHADLQLDTFNVNAHTTASDSLSANLLILTKIGRKFSSRVCASILKAANLDELIAHSIDEYRDLAIFYGNNPANLSSLRQRFVSEKKVLPLFDIESYVRDFEKLLLSLL